MTAGDGWGRKTPSTWPAEMAVVAAPGSMATMVTSFAGSTPFSSSQVLRTVSWIVPGGKVAIFLPTRSAGVE